jgi:predicted DsbA family dithiol-disulfide isomerase
MKVEIWSDVMCPFCYIGKRKFENALAQFPEKSQIEIEWKSFQLNRNLITDPSKTINGYLSEVKGISIAEAQKLSNHVSQLAKAEGLTFNMDKALVANSFDAHRFLHYAKTKGKQLEAEECLFKAYFTDGKNIADISTLLQLAAEIGLSQNELEAVLKGKEFTAEVNQDINEATQLGVNGVPFFVFNRKYALSGAQASSVFLAALNKSLEEFQE